MVIMHGILRSSITKIILKNSYTKFRFNLPGINQLAEFVDNQHVTELISAKLMACIHMYT